ncbi:MAG: zf-TFIIB domain-containing protein [Phycisphaeraceae bacterium]|nr:zf-TFIIB domain-containing protein [Phycisphaeraceae bacterium]
MTEERLQRINCPKCQQMMTQITVDDGIVVDRCSNCGGLFLDVFEKEYLAKAKQRAIDIDLETGRDAGATDEIHVISCPRDQSRMIHIQALENHKVGIETCTICGAVFLDAGELKQLTRKSLLDKLKSVLN